MNKVLCSPATKCAALLVGYISALSFARAVSVTFNYYIGGMLGSWPKIWPIVSFMLFVTCMAVFTLSIRRGKAAARKWIWQKADFFLLIALVYCVLFLCVYYGGIIYRSAMLLLLLSAAAYAAAAILLSETAARLRDGVLSDTLHWIRFFKTYTVGQPIGFVMALLLIGDLLYLLVICPFNAGDLRLGVPTFKPSQPLTADGYYVFEHQSYFNLPLFLFFVFLLVALTYFCTFVLSLSAEYDKANAEKIRAERFKSELITNVSHDIRTPLTAIISYVDLLKALPIENNEFAEYMGVLDRKTVRLKTLISDLMEASKAGTGNMAVDMREIDLAEIIGQIAGEFEDQFSERDLALVFRQPDTPASAQADSGLLWRVLENLFGNAAKYAMPGTRIFAETAMRDGRAVFLLKNTSQNPIDLDGDVLTEQFIRGDRARQTEGNGLGLYIAKSLAELMGGRFSIRATGDLFEVEIVFGCCTIGNIAPR